MASELSERTKAEQRTGAMLVRRAKVLEYFEAAIDRAEVGGHLSLDHRLVVRVLYDLSNDVTTVWLFYRGTEIAVERLSWMTVETMLTQAKWSYDQYQYLGPAVLPELIQAHISLLKDTPEGNK